MKNKWRPLLNGVRAKKAWAFINALEKETESYEKNFINSPKGSNWPGNVIGVSLFCHYLYKVTGTKKYKVRAQSILNLAVEGLGRHYASDQLFGGFTGLAWLAEYLNEKT